MGLWIWLVIAILLIYGIYAPLSELFFHLWHCGTFYRGVDRKRLVALTFDDGPDERYTPQILDILRLHDAKATFFVVGERAVRHPDLIRRILAEGHEIASHSYRHKHAWLRGPLSTWSDIRKSKQVIENLTGKPVVYYRPPWGAFNIVTRIACSAMGLYPVLWSHRAIDWLAGDYAEEIIERIVPKVGPGSVVLCHDAGGAPFAPLNMIRALPTVLTDLRNLGFEFATVGVVHETLRAVKSQPDPVQKYPFPRRLLIRVWSIVEWAFRMLYKIVPINEMYRTSLAKWHHGTRLDAENRVLIRNGDATADIHFQNETLITISSSDDDRAMLRAIKLARSGLRDFARLLEYHPQFRDVTSISAVTLMNRGIEMLGFHVEEIPMTREHKRLQRYMRFLMGMYHSDGFKRLKEGSRALSLKLIWMSRDELIERYGDKRGE